MDGLEDFKRKKPRQSFEVRAKNSIISLTTDEIHIVSPRFLRQLLLLLMTFFCSLSLKFVNYNY